MINSMVCPLSEHKKKKNFELYSSTKDVCTFMADLYSVIEFLGFNVRISGKWLKNEQLN